MLYSTFHTAKEISIADLVTVFSSCLTWSMATTFVILSAINTLDIYVGNDLGSLINVIWSLSLMYEEVEIAIDLWEKFLIT